VDRDDLLRDEPQTFGSTPYERSPRSASPETLSRIRS
jgi:hypothetical protein